MEIKGDLKNIRASVVSELERLKEIEIPVGQITTAELNANLMALTSLIEREIAVYINRQGKIIQVSVGDTNTVELPSMPTRVGKRLSGIRCIHTHPQGNSTLSELDLSSLRRLRFDVMVAVAQDKKGDINASMAFLTGETDEASGQMQLEVFGPVDEKELDDINLTALTSLINRTMGRDTLQNTDEEQEKAVLAGVDFKKKQEWTTEESLEELRQLAKTAGAEVTDIFQQSRDKPDPALFLGKGKVQEIAAALQNSEATLFITDDELAPSQQRNLERMLGVRVIDRTALILDIFAQRAQSFEGKLQVELAQLRYNLPRISGQGAVLSRLGGGIGTRGPGETKLEVDRRRIHSRIHEIEGQIERVKKHRSLHQAKREVSGLPIVALVGYTNAGKSTMLNALSGADVYAEDKLFATLDTTTRRVALPDKQEMLLTDTVGFIQKLPHTLVKAFNATLEEVAEADLLLHIVDCSNENSEKQISAVLAVLKELKADEKPMIYVFNKADRLPADTYLPAIQGAREGIFVSAKNPDTLKPLLDKIADFFAEGKEKMTLLIPFADGSAVTNLHNTADVQSTDYTEDGTLLTVLLAKSEAKKYEKYRIEE